MGSIPDPWGPKRVRKARMAKNGDAENSKSDSAGPSYSGPDRLFGRIIVDFIDSGTKMHGATKRVFWDASRAPPGGGQKFES